MSDQQRYRLKEMAARQSELVDRVQSLRKEAEYLRKENERLIWLLGNANEQSVERKC